MRGCEIWKMKGWEISVDMRILRYCECEILRGCKMGGMRGHEIEILGL